ncbi:uncharacterized protein LOC143218678 [Lasioglossum baleicum]|uniref:uncharacterized protein LOC143218678 n=1 Tax=Lasioglossum baleicum TaxID=434251 RepID=UPI003FCE8D8D
MIEEKLSQFHCEQSRNILRYLRHRDIGLCTVHKSRAQIDFIAETLLVLKRHKKLKYNLPGVPKATFLMVSSPDGTKMASTHGNHKIYITEVATGKHIKTLVGHPRTPWCIAFHPSSSQILASGCLGGQVRVWDINNGCQLWETENQTVIASLAFHPTKRLLVVATCNQIYFWDWTTAEPYDIASTTTDDQKVRYVAFDNLGRKLVTGITNTPQMRMRVTKSEEKYEDYRDMHLLLSACIGHIGRVTDQRIRCTNMLVPKRSANSLHNNTELRNQSQNSSAEPPVPNVEPSRISTSRSPVHIRLDAIVNEDVADGYISIFRHNLHAVQRYRVQAWDFSNGETPDITDYSKNIVVRNCDIRNDATIDISSDGKLLTAITPARMLQVTTIAVYSLQWETLGKRICSTDIDCESAVSVAFSPTQQHLVVGVARNCNSADANYMAHIYRLIDNKDQPEKQTPYRYFYPLCRYMEHVTRVSNRYRMTSIRQILHSITEPNNSSLNCIRWLPQPGQGLVYATNTGELNIIY